MATVQRERKLIAADPGNQQALTTRWGAASVDNVADVLFNPVLIVFGLALLAVVALLVASPLTLVPLLANVPVAARMAQLGVHMLMAAVWAPGLTGSDLRLLMRVTFSVLAAWSLVQLTPPVASLTSAALGTFATQSWWWRLLRCLRVKSVVVGCKTVGQTVEDVGITYNTL